MVKDGVKLTEALAELEKYVAEVLHGESYCIVTDGVWDLQIQLYAESKRKGFPFPSHLHHFLDIKSEFLKFYPWFPKTFRPSLKQLLHGMVHLGLSPFAPCLPFCPALSLNIVGHHHSGIDDCRTIASITRLLLSLGHPFSSPLEVIDRADPFSDPLFVDFGSVCDPDSWLCTTATCGIWNRPWMHYCRFCDGRKSDIVYEDWARKEAVKQTVSPVEANS
jgi:hypothetical protein